MERERDGEAGNGASGDYDRVGEGELGKKKWRERVWE